MYTELESNSPIIRSLKKTILKSGYRYVQIQRNENVAVYAQHEGDKIIAFEVFQIKLKKSGSRFLRQFYYEKFPSDEDIGRTGKSFANREKALLFFIYLSSKLQ